MKAVFKQTPMHRAMVFMRTAGYAPYANREGDESFVRRVGGGEFPRFHAYVEEEKNPQTISIHVDQKGHTYEGAHAHSGEYVSDAIASELARMSVAIGIPMAILVDKKGNPLER
jgi:hypothetical protein